jgi:uncharacterized protein YjbJ (UPF0337 family)
LINGAVFDAFKQVVINETEFNLITIKIRFMNTFIIKGTWNELKGTLKQKFANLTDDMELLKEGQKERLLGRIQQRIGKTKEG